MRFFYDSCSIQRPRKVFIKYYSMVLIIIYNLHRVTLDKNRFMIGFITSTKINNYSLILDKLKKKVIIITPFNKTLNRKSVIDFIITNLATK